MSTKRKEQRERIDIPMAYLPTLELIRPKKEEEPAKTVCQSEQNCPNAARHLAPNS